MEDALVHINNVCLNVFDVVLILVLMEDALVRLVWFLPSQPLQRGLNPCFNGRCTRTLRLSPLNMEIVYVLILVLMEDALVLDI